MAWSSTCRISPQNFLLGNKDELATTTPTEGNNTSAVLCNFTFATAITPLVISALFSIAQYSKDDLQRIFKTFFDLRPLAPPLAPILAPPQYKSSCKRLLKVRFLDVYWSKTYLECYNFSSMRTILPPPGPKITIVYHLPPFFLKIPPCFAGSNIIGRWRIRLAFPLSRKNLGSFFAKAWVSPRSLLTLFRALFEKTSNIS